MTTLLSTNHRNGRGNPRQRPPIAERTGPLETLRGKRVLVVADAQNWDLSARDLGYRVSYRRLAESLTRSALRVSLHVVFARHSGADDRRWNYYLGRAWTPHAKTTRVRKRRGRDFHDSNADNYVAFLAGLLCSRLPVDLMIIGTGDGQLAEDVAEAVRLLPTPRPTATMSLAGSTAARLNERTSKLISANLEIGKDCLRRRQSHEPSILAFRNRFHLGRTA